MAESLAVSSNDFGNVIAGFLVMASAFAVGKIAVDNIAAHRRENFQRKGQPKEAVKAKESTLDGIVKVAGIGFGLYRMVHDLPELVKQVESFTK